MFLLSLVVAICVINIVIFCLRQYRFRKILSKIPSPPGHWLLGNAIWLIQNPPEKIFDYARDCAKEYWPIYRFTNPYIVTVNFLHPADFELILSPMKHLTKGPVYNFLKSWLGEGLLTSSNLQWQQRRKILTPAFHFKILQQFLKIFNEESDNLCKEIENKSGDDESGINIIPLVTSMTLQSVTETAMGMSNVDQVAKQKYKKSIYEMGKIVVTRVTRPWLRFWIIFKLSKEGALEKSCLKTLHDFTLKIIKDRERHILSVSPENFVQYSYSEKKIMRMLDILLMTKIQDGNIDVNGIREEVDTFMFEGHDTTTAAIIFLLLTLANKTKIQEEVRNEIYEILGSKTSPSFQDLQEMPYTERVIKECLRLYPSVPFVSRIASEDFVTHTGYKIPKGAILNMHILDLHRDPRIYPDPLKFDPDRFLPAQMAERHPFAYLPFSAGPRNCIGQRFALLEIKSVLCAILRKFDLQAVDKPEDIQVLQDLVLRTSTPVRIRFIPRTSTNISTSEADKRM